MQARLSKKLVKEFTLFLLNHPPRQFSNELRRLLIEYIESQVETGFPLEFRSFLWAIGDLFELLELAANEEIQKPLPLTQKKKTKSKKKMQ